MLGSRANLQRYFDLADADDLREARMAYPRYRRVMDRYAEGYALPLEFVVAAFVALSPNSDYIGNLRSLVSLLEALRLGVALDRVVVSTYNHRKLRAYSYLTGSPFNARGLKITSFYHNILDPQALNWVTVDGHVTAAWRGRDDMTMKQALLHDKEYKTIRDDVMVLACHANMVPCQYQAAVWFARKRHLKIKYSPQYDLFSDKSGIVWEQIKPYPFRAG